MSSDFAPALFALEMPTNIAIPAIARKPMINHPTVPYRSSKQASRRHESRRSPVRALGRALSPVNVLWVGVLRQGEPSCSRWTERIACFAQGSSNPKGVAGDRAGFVARQAKGRVRDQPTAPPARAAGSGSAFGFPRPLWLSEPPRRPGSTRPAPGVAVAPRARPGGQRGQRAVGQGRGRRAKRAWREGR